MPSELGSDFLVPFNIILVDLARYNIRAFEFLNPNSTLILILMYPDI